MDRSESLAPLHGDLVLLRQPVPADVAARIEAPRDPEEDLMYGGSGTAKQFTAQEAEAWFAPYSRQQVEQERRFVVAALRWPDGGTVDSPDGRCIGTIRLHQIVSQDRRARLAVGLFDRRFWSHGYGSEAIRLVLGYGFRTMQLHRIDLRVLAYNGRAIRAYEKCGFVREGVERESALVNGVWHDDIIMSVLDREFNERGRTH
ncbi:MAG: GNAT family N-acetyltransferase [Chloroflexi bacterium]|nr:GNAT family N-acetyltransferase [Chloroflexota bacterium]